MVRYFKSTLDIGHFFFATSQFTLTAFCDAEWAACKDTRKSITGFYVLVGSTPISWRSKKQNIVSKSSAEVEYHSMAAVVCEIQWIVYLLKDFRVFPSLSIGLYCDNQAAIHISQNAVYHERTKHVEIDCHIVREKFKE